VPLYQKILVEPILPQIADFKHFSRHKRV